MQEKFITIELINKSIALINCRYIVNVTRSIYGGSIIKDINDTFETALSLEEINNLIKN